MLLIMWLFKAIIQLFEANFLYPDDQVFDLNKHKGFERQ